MITSMAEAGPFGPPDTGLARVNIMREGIRHGRQGYARRWCDVIQANAFDVPVRVQHDGVPVFVEHLERFFNRALLFVSRDGLVPDVHPVPTHYVSVPDRQGIIEATFVACLCSVQGFPQLGYHC